MIEDRWLWFSMIISFLSIAIVTTAILGQTYHSEGGIPFREIPWITGYEICTFYLGIFARVVLIMLGLLSFTFYIIFDLDSDSFAGMISIATMAAAVICALYSAIFL